MRTKLARLLLLFAASSLLFLGGELYLRSVHGGPTDGGLGTSGRRHFDVYQSDGSLGYVLRSGWSTLHETHEFSARVRTNNFGFRRDEDVTREKNEGTRRILVLGDSMTFGFGVANDEMFTALVERRVRAGGEEVEVINAGVPGYSSDHYLVYLRQEAFGFHPDLILVMTNGNDIEDLAWSRLTVDGDGLPRRTVSRRRMIDRRGRMRFVNEAGFRLPGWLEAPPEFLANRSVLFNWLRFRIARIWIRFLQGDGLSNDSTNEETGPQLEFGFSEMSEEEINSALATNAHFRRQYYAYLNSAIEREADAHGVPLHFMYLGPSQSEVAQDCDQRPGCIKTLVSSALYVDAHLFYIDDGHANAEGHRWIAERIESETLEAIVGEADQP